jgi:hypothetical protein
MPYYNTAPPTPTTKNTINSIMATLPNIRDFLLLKNLTPQYPFLGTTTNGSPKIGQPVLDTMVGTGANAVPIGLPLETEGILWKEQNVLPNMFKNVGPDANALVSINYIQDIPYTSVYGTAEWPQGIQSYPTGANDEVKAYGIYGKSINANFKTKNTAKNLYLDVDKQIDMADFINLQPIEASQQIKGYLDTYGGLNLGGDEKGIKAANIIGSVVSGQGLGLAKGGVVPNFDIRSSLAGRVLGAAGAIKDTKLGMIGGQQLALALANNAAFNLQQDILGALNIQDNILSLVKGQGFAAFPRPNYTITVPASTLGKVGDYTSKLLGFTIPRSYMLDEGSIFQSESGEVGNIERANKLLVTTGKGQIQALIANANANLLGTAADGKKDNPNETPFRTGYAPGYANKKGTIQITNAKIYAYYTEGNVNNVFAMDNSKGGAQTIPTLSFNKDNKAYGFESPEDIAITQTFVGHTSDRGLYDERRLTTVGFSWGTTNPGLTNSNSDYSPLEGNKKSLLVKTQKLFNSYGMKTIVTEKGDMNNASSQIEQANGYGFSKGNAVMRKEVYTENGYYDYGKNRTAEETYCRSWTTLARYDSVKKLVRNHRLYNNEGKKTVPFRVNTENSVLENTGFVKIAPYTNQFLNKDVPRYAKNYMLSIENLAWHDRKELLPKGELGQGDPVTGKQGRMMWFPPYDIQISESTSVDWESNKFIGRGENVYTYNNTERSGQLSFKIIVDHSTYTNTFRGSDGPDDHYVASFMAGCIEPDSFWTDKFTVKQTSEIVPRTVGIPQKKVAPEPEIPPGDIYIYFPNDQATLPILYECGVSGNTNGVPDLDKKIDYSVYLSPTYNGPNFALGTYPSNFTYKTECANNNGVHKEWPDRHNYGLNYVGPYTQATEVDGKKYYGWLDNELMPDIAAYIRTKCKHCVIEVTGYASPQGRYACNQQLSDSRAENVANQLRNQWASAFDWTPEQAQQRIKKMKSEPIKQSDSKCKVCPSSVSNKQRAIDCPPDTLGCKLDRRVKIHFRYDADAALADVAEPKPCSETITEEVTTTIKQKFYNETMFFDKLKKTDRFIFDSFREKIRYFHPAFHSTTPEGLNSRLTFLQQCTRQGPTDNMETNNLAFGRAPICILRVGDFYHTKIIIDSLNIEYEPLVWDLNPEGIGVQPMIANVSLSFKFLGGESLYGPINKLQNALSFNYYANAGVYEARADYISEEKPAGITGDSVTGLYLSSGVPSTAEDPSITTAAVEKSRTNDCDPSQTAMNNTSVSKSQPQAVSATTEPTITGIEIFGIGDAYTLFGVGDSGATATVGVNATDRAVDITLKNEGIAKLNDDGTINKLISDDKLKEIVAKGITIKIEMSPTPNNTSRVEEIISFDNKTMGKSIWDLFAGTYFLGTKILPGEYPLVDTMPEEGNYMITVIYDGKVVQTLMGVASNTKSFDSRVS